MKKRFQTVSVWFLLATGIYIVSEIYRSNIIEDWTPTNPIIYGAILLFFALFDPAKKTSAKILTCISIAACIRCVGTLDRLRCNETTNTKFLTVLFITVALCTLTIMAFVQTNILTNRLKIFQNIPAVCMLGVFIVNGTDFLRLLLDGKLDWLLLLNCIVYLFLMLGARQLSKIFCRLGYESAGEEVPPFGIWHALRNKQFHINSVWFLVAIAAHILSEVVIVKFGTGWDPSTTFTVVLSWLYLAFLNPSNKLHAYVVAVFAVGSALVGLRFPGDLLGTQFTVLDVIPVISYIAMSGSIAILLFAQSWEKAVLPLAFSFFPAICMALMAASDITNITIKLIEFLKDRATMPTYPYDVLYYIALVPAVYQLSRKIYKYGTENAEEIS